MSARYQAVILAAGQGSRLGERVDGLPKALLPIGPRALDDPTETCFLRRQCEVLRRFGVEQIVVVIGYEKELMRETIDSWQLGVELVVNTAEIAASGSLHSFQFAARSEFGVLDGRCQTLMLDADIVYDPRAIKLLLDAPAHSALLVCTSYRQSNEEVLVYGTPERPRFIGKGLTPELVAGATCIGEATGAVKYAPQDHPLARATMDWMLGDPGAPVGSAERRGFGPARQATEHEELAGRFLHYQRMSCVTFGAELPFMEVDDQREYEYLRSEFYPRLLQREAKQAR